MEILQVVISVEQRQEEKQKGCAQRCCVNGQIDTGLHHDSLLVFANFYSIEGMSK